LACYERADKGPVAAAVAGIDRGLDLDFWTVVSGAVLAFFQNKTFYTNTGAEEGTIGKES